MKVEAKLSRGTGRLTGGSGERGGRGRNMEEIIRHTVCSHIKISLCNTAPHIINIINENF